MAISEGGSGASAGAIRAGKAFVELFAKDEAVIRTLAATQARLKQFSGAVAKIGTGVTAIGAAGYAVIDKLENSTITRAVEFSRLGARFGDTTENLSSFAYAAGTTGVSLQDLNQIFENWGERVSEAAQGTGEAAESFKLLGLNAAQLALKPRVEQMKDLADAMQKVANNEQRLQLFSKFFSDQGQVLNPLFKKGSAGINALMLEASRLGATVSTDVANSAVKADAAFNRLYTSVKGVLFELGAAVMSSDSFLSTFIDGATHAVVQVRKWLAANRPIVASIEMGVYATLGLGAALLGVAGGLKLAAISLGPVIMGIGLLGSVGAFLATWPGLLAAIGIGTVAAVASFMDWKRIGESLGGVLSSVSKFASTLVGDVGAAWKGISAAISQGDLEAAFEIASLGIQVVWEDTTVAVKATWQEFMNWWQSNTEMLADQLESAMAGVGEAAVAAMRSAGESALDLIVGPEARKKMQLGLEQIAIEAAGVVGAINEETLRDERRRLNREFDEAGRPKDQGHGIINARGPDAGGAQPNRADALREQLRNRAAELESIRTGANLLGLFRGLTNQVGSAAAGVQPAVFNAQRGAFAGSFGQGAFGFGDQVGQKMLEEQKSTTKVLGEVLNVVSGFSFKWAT